MITAFGDRAGNPVLKRAALESLARTSKAESAPAWSDGLKSAFQSLLANEDAGVRLASLPLIARWDKQSSLANDVKSVIAQLQSQLKDPTQPEAARSQAAVALLGVRQFSAEILPGVAALLGTSEPATLQEQIVKALGESGDPAGGPALAGVFGKLSAPLQTSAFNQILKRGDWSLSFVEALKGGKVAVASIGPAGLHRLRYHPDAAVAKRASEVIDELRGPEAKEKQALIAKLTPEVTKPGDINKGHALFTQNCATCHRLNDEGKEVGPVLTGMGAHGPAELLVHILDPNREVDPSFAAWNFETRDGESYDGIIARENRNAVMLRNAAGEMELKRDQIKSQRNTGRSLMPEGFESLGAEGLRDLLAFVTAGDNRFRVLDLRRAFTADSTKGIYVGEQSVNETLRFRRFGMVQADGIPFEVVSPTRSPGGRNVVVLKGGSGFARTLAQKVEVEAAGISANRLHFLGGVAGWGYPCCGENKDLPAARITVVHEGGEKEEFVLKNGVEIADYNGMTEVPGSKLVPDVVPRGTQVRYFTRELSKPAPLSKIILESFDNVVAPTFVAITAETGGSPRPAPAPAQAAAPAVEPLKWGDGIRTLLVGGGSSHDFNRWFNLADLATLRGQDRFSVNYTERYADVIPALRQIDVLGWSANQDQKDPVLRKALMDYAEAGKGLVLIHPGNWYIWGDWPEWNRSLVGGGARSHDRYGEFEVTVNQPDHPLMRGVPGTFRVSDELYHFQADPAGTPIEVLATGKNLMTGKSYPVVWITKHPKARVANITLGHDGMSHDHIAYKKLLVNAVAWASNRPLSASR
jgi:putative heme-binding domain-containing protein